MTADRAKLRLLADLLDDDAVFEFAETSIGAARDKAPRRPDDRDSGDVLEDLIKSLRGVA